MTMYKAIVLYHPPDDRTAFDEYYWRVHVPLASRMQGIRRWTITKLEGAETGTDVPYYLLVELYADDRSALFTALESEEGLESTSDVKVFATDAVTFMYGHEQVIS
jgi:uncharacterized protein (TIGR02118 family)